MVSRILPGQGGNQVFEGCTKPATGWCSFILLKVNESFILEVLSAQMVHVLLKILFDESWKH